MKMGKTGTWGAMCCTSEYDHTALRSWFPFVPADWVPLVADCWEDFETCETPKLRVLFRTPDGTLKLGERRRNKRTTTHSVKAPAPSLLRQWQQDHRLAAIDAGAPS